VSRLERRERSERWRSERRRRADRIAVIGFFVLG
jgi:hypothetical protein